MSLFAVVEVTRGGYLTGMWTRKTIRFVGSLAGAHKWASEKAAALPDGETLPFCWNGERMLREQNLLFPEGLACYGDNLAVNWMGTMYMVAETNY